MSTLSDFEKRIGGAVEGVFAGMFRSPVQPVEIAKTLGRAMDDGRSIGVGKIYAPLGYVVALSPDDAAILGDFTATLAGELATYLTGRARESGYHLAGTPKVSFTVHDDLRLGRFRVSAELTASGAASGGGLEPEPGDPAAGEPRAHASTVDPWGDDEPSLSNDMATVTVGDLDHDVLLQGDRVTVGRLAGCAIRLSDSNASREHATFVRDPDGWSVRDLDSTNGTLLNGEPVDEAHLRDGDVIEIGLTRLTYHEPGR